MPSHDRAWDGIEICVLNTSPLVPMQIEQAISTACPSIETRVSSFEKYEEAYDFCKSQKNVGLLILAEKCGTLPILSVFRELSAPADSSNTPCYAIVTYEQSENALVSKTVGKNPKLLDYVPESALVTPDAALISMQAFWALYSVQFESEYIPKALASALLSFYGSYQGDDSSQFILRATTLLESQLNISWLESVAVKWQPFISFVKSREPSFLMPVEKIVSLCQVADAPELKDMNALTTLAADASASLPSKVTAAVRYLEFLRKSGTLEQELSNLQKQSRTAPAILRLVDRYRDNLKEFAREAASSLTPRKAI